MGLVRLLMIVSGRAASTCASNRLAPEREDYKGGAPANLDVGACRRQEKPGALPRPQFFSASTPSPLNSVANPARRKRCATSAGRSRPLLSLFGDPV